MIGDLANTVLHPVDTAKSLYGLGSGIIQLAIPGEQGNEKLATALGKFYVDRYGSLEKAYISFYNDPVGVAMDASVVLGGAGSLLNKGAGLATRGAEAVSLSSNAAKAGRLGGTLTKASELLDPISLTARGIKGVGAGSKGKIADTLAKESENILTRGMGNPRTLEKAKGVSPITMDELFKKYNLYDRSPEAFQSGFNTANKEARSLLESAPTSIDTRNIVKMFDDEISKLAEKAKTSTKDRLAMEELARRKEMFLEGIQNPNLSTPLINDATKVYDIKSAFQSDLPPSSFGQSSQDIGRNKGITRSYKTLLSGVEQQAQGIKNLGREQSALLNLKKIASSGESRAAARQNINFSRLGGATAGGVVAGIPGAVGGYVAERIANSPQFLGGTSKALQLGSKAIKSSFIPDPIQRGVSGAYKTSKSIRPITSGQLPNKQSQESRRKESQSYKGSISQPKNVFKNKSAFGTPFKLKGSR